MMSSPTAACRPCWVLVPGWVRRSMSSEVGEIENDQGPIYGDTVDGVSRQNHKAG